jgi:TetR/AcrR family transcriptional repressor of mexJK operon
MYETGEIVPDEVPRPASNWDRKHRAVLAAAEELFLRDSYLGTSMDEVAERSAVSKQTVYKHFGSKERLFVELVTAMTAGAGDSLDDVGDLPRSPGELAPFLERHALKELQIVLSPRLLQLRRLVIGEVSRFPELAEALYEHGPQRAITLLTAVITQLQATGLLATHDPRTAAVTLNWLVLAAPINEAMLRGDRAIPSAPELEAHAREAIRIFLAAHT